MPEDLTDEMREAWDFIVSDLTAADVIDHADAGVLEAAAVFWGRARQARREMSRRRTLLITTPQGVIPNRLLDVERNSWKEFRALAESLPLSPWGRARLGLKSNGSKAGGPEAEIGLPPRLRAVGSDD